MAIDGGLDMIPWRIQLRRLLEAGASDAGFRRRALAALLAMVFIVAAFSTGLRVDIELGRRGSDVVAADGLQPTRANGSGGGATSADGTTAIDPVTGEPLSTGDAGGLDGTDSASEGSGPGAAGGGAEAPGTETAQGGGDQGGPQASQAPADLCAGASLSATDRGVTAETVKIGVLIADLGPLGKAGFNVGVSGDYNRIIPAWLNEINANGGMGCRKATFVLENFDVLSVDDMIAKCKKMTQDHKVFAVITTGGYDSVAQLCIARDNKTPFLNTEAEPADWYRESAPYLWNIGLMSKDRTHRNHVRLLVEAGELKPGKDKVGVVYHGIPNVAPSVEKALLPEMAARGIKPEKVIKLSADSEQALAQINQSVLDFQRAGVDYVFMPMNLIFKTQFMQQAEKQNYYPRYTDSDHYYGCFDFVTATYPERSWDKTKCVTAAASAGVPNLEEYSKTHPFGVYADQVYLRTNKDGYDKGGESDKEKADAERALHISNGSLLMALDKAADRVGPNLTREAWGNSMGQTGEFTDIISPFPMTFRPDKWDGPDHIAMVEWHAEAGGGFKARMYRQVLAGRPAFY